MDRTSGRRGLLQLGTTCALVLATPVLARDAKKKAEDVISPPEDLMREHAILDRILLIYESGMRRIGQGEDIDPAVFVQSATIMRDFIHGYHEKSEEELVFPRFKTAGRMVELVNVLLTQHGAGRKLTERILAAAPQARSREPREAMGRDIQAFIAGLHRDFVATIKQYERAVVRLHGRSCVQPFDRLCRHRERT